MKSNELVNNSQAKTASSGIVPEPVVKTDVSVASNLIFRCTRGGTDARGKYTDAGFIVLKGSKGRTQVSKSFEYHTAAKRREELMLQHKIVQTGDCIVFKEDVLFTSPSGASAAVCGNATNGWTEWKTETGVTLHAYKRCPAP